MIAPKIVSTVSAASVHASQCRSWGWWRQMSQLNFTLGLATVDEGPDETSRFPLAVLAAPV